MINKLCSAHQTPLTWAIRYSKRDAVLLLLRGAPGAREKKNMLKLAIETEREALIKTGWKETAGGPIRRHVKRAILGSGGNN